MAITYLGAKRIQGTKADRVSDSLGSDVDGTNTGVSLIPIKDYAVFDGSNDYITFATKFNQMQQAGSFSVWLKPSNISSTGNDIIFDNSDASSSNNGFTIRHSDHSGGKTLVLFGIWGSTDSSITTDSEILTGDEWQHLCVTYDGTTGKIYRNGVLQKSGSMTANSSAGTYNARIGWSANGNDHKFEGGMYQALVYNDALTQSEVTTLYNSGTPVTSPSTSGLVSKYNLSSDTNDSQGSNNGTNTGVTFSTDNYKLGTGAYSFDGTNDYVTAGSTSDFTFLHDGGKNTITFWLKKDTPESGDVRVVLSTADGTSNGIEIVYLDRSSSSEDRKVKIEFTNASSQQIGLYYAQQFFPNDSNWHHYAIVTDLSNSYLKAYVDGTEKSADSSYPSFTGTPVSSAQQHVLNIGRRGSGTFYLDGDLNDMSFWDRNLSTTEITALYNSGTGALVSTLSNKAGLKAHYTMDSTSLGATAIFTPDDDYASASGWTDVDTGGDIAIDTTNKGVTYTDVNVGDSGIGKSLGTTLSNSKWLCQFTFQIADWNTNDAGLVSLTSDHTQGFKVSGLKTINFMPQGTPLGAGSGSYNRFVLMSGQTNSYAEVTSSNNALAVNTQYWVDMYRDGSNIKCKVWTNADRTGTPHFESSNLAVGTNLDGLTGIQHWNENSADSDIGTAWVREVKVYDGVTATEGCKNNASTTSELDGMTNLPVNTIFEQTDDTPKYYWKQSDNTWLMDYHTDLAVVHASTGDGLYCGGAGSLTNNTSLATDYVWATNSANLPNNLGYSAGGGYKSSFQACGGYIASGSFFDSSTIWNGSSWASAVALDTQRRDTTAYGGSPSSAIIALGRNNSGTEVDSSSKWNGTSWSSAGAVGSQAGEHVGGDGLDTSMLITGGSRGKEADKWNGRSWSATTALPQDTSSHNHAGRTAESAHVAGGNGAYAYDWDGTTWTSVTAITLGSDTTPRYVSGGGNKDHHWVMCGLDGGSSMNNCTLWNGSSWTAKGNMTETQYAGLGDGTIR